MKTQADELKRHSRIWGSTEARAARDALHALSGALPCFSAGKLRLGTMQFTLLRHAGRSYQLLFDIDACRW